jgi:hypothetical protein
VAVKGGALRDTSMVLLAKALGMSKEDVALRGAMRFGAQTELVGAGCARMRRSVVRFAQLVKLRFAQVVKRRDTVPLTSMHGAHEATRPVVLLATQEVQRAHELAPAQPELGSLRRHVQLTSIELDAGHRHEHLQPPPSSGLSTRSRPSRRYEMLDDDMEETQGGL